MPASLAELVLGWETQFRLVAFLDSTRRLRPDLPRLGAGPPQPPRARPSGSSVRDAARRFDRYFAAGEVCFRLREHALYRVVLAKRPQPKRWAVLVRPSDCRPATAPGGAAGASPARRPGALRRVQRVLRALARAHDDVLLRAVARRLTRRTWSAALDRKIDFFAERVAAGAGCRVLDVGCGWGGTLRRLARAARRGRRRRPHPERGAARVRRALGPVPGGRSGSRAGPSTSRPEPLRRDPSFGAFEHFARDGTTGPERIAAYRRSSPAASRGWRPGAGSAWRRSRTTTPRTPPRRWAAARSATPSSSSSPSRSART